MVKEVSKTFRKIHELGLLSIKYQTHTKVTKHHPRRKILIDNLTQTIKNQVHKI